jgi:hypothetical protein
VLHAFAWSSHRASYPHPPFIGLGTDSHTPCESSQNYCGVASLEARPHLRLFLIVSSTLHTTTSDNTSSRNLDDFTIDRKPATRRQAARSRIPSSFEASQFTKVRAHRPSRLTAPPNTVSRRYRLVQRHTILSPGDRHFEAPKSKVGTETPHPIDYSSYQLSHAHTVRKDIAKPRRPRRHQCKKPALQGLSADCIDDRAASSTRVQVSDVARNHSVHRNHH